MTSGAFSEDNARRLPRVRRITQGSEIRALFQRGKRSRTAHLDVFVSPSPAAFSRIGIIVPRHKQTAVRRNLLKRRLREALRTQLLPRLRSVGANRDLLVRARREAYDADYQDLVRELLEWLEQAP